MLQIRVGRTVSSRPIIHRRSSASTVCSASSGGDRAWTVHFTTLSTQFARRPPTCATASVTRLGRARPNGPRRRSNARFRRTTINEPAVRRRYGDSEPATPVALGQWEMDAHPRATRSSRHAVSKGAGRSVLPGGVDARSGAGPRVVRDARPQGSGAARIAVVGRAPLAGRAERGGTPHVRGVVGISPRAPGVSRQQA